MTEVLYALPRQPDTQRAAALLKQALAQCAHVDQPDLNGMARSMDLAALPFPNFGDATMATELTTHVGPASAQAEGVTVTKGRTIMSITTVGLVADTALTQRVVAAAYAKLG